MKFTQYLKKVHPEYRETYDEPTGDYEKCPNCGDYPVHINDIHSCKGEDCDKYFCPNCGDKNQERCFDCLEKEGIV